MEEIEKTPVIAGNESLSALASALRSSVDYQYGEWVKKDNVDKYFVTQGDGVYEIREDKLATYYAKLGTASIPNLESTIKGKKIDLKIPKVPIEMFWEVVKLFQAVHQKYSTEAYVRIYYSRDRNEFYYYVPDQDISGALVKWKDDDDVMEKLSETDILVLQIHSHHNMTGRFSTIDDDDHVYLHGIFMVIGNIFSATPSTQLRFCFEKNRIDVEMSDIFQSKEDSIDLSVFGDWDSKMHKNVYVPKVYSYPEAYAPMSSRKYKFEDYTQPNSEKDYVSSFEW